MATVKVGSARIDENGNAYGGKAGDQTGKEVSTQNWYKHSKGWRVFRAKSAAVAAKIAEAMQAACDNNKIGYDQWNRDTLYAQAEKVGFDVSKVTTACETDCSALVRVCCAYAGIMGIPSDFRTGNMPANLLATGAFVEMTGSKYTDQSTFLGKGDILVTKSSGHTVVVLNNGSKYENATTQTDKIELGDRLLKKGMKGDDVKALQKALIKLGYSCGKWGADGDFGSATETALKKFQKDHKCEVDGKYGPESHKALQKALNNKTSGKVVKVTGNTVNVRDKASTAGKIIFVARKGETYEYSGNTASNGWNGLIYKGSELYISGNYSVVENKGAAAASSNVEYVPKGKIADVSKWQCNIDWAAAAKELDFCILRAAYTFEKIDESFDEYAAGCKANNIPFGVYQYSKAKTEEEAIKEAEFLWNAAKAHKPVFWTYDCEEEGITREIVSAWVKRMRELGAERVGLYIAHHRYTSYNLNVSDVDFVWIPRYGKNDGAQHTKPDYKCDLWQYTSAGTLAGVSGKVDLNVVTNDGKSLNWFRGGV